MFNLTEKALEAIKNAYPPGTRVTLVSMDDAHAPPVGTHGTVKHVDDIGTVHVAWDTGSNLGAVFNEDVIMVIDDAANSKL